jgi:NADPH-dependent curcumin reductase CurA
VEDQKNQQWWYIKRPEAEVGPEHYELRDTTLSTSLADNELLVRALYFSVDPYMRIQQAARHTWEEPHPLPAIQQGTVVAEVLQSNDESGHLSAGDFVSCDIGWQRYAKVHVLEVQKLDPAAASLTTALGVLGMPGRTAWFGLIEAGRPRAGDTVVVSGAAGAVGSLVVQFAKLSGCHVIGIAGGLDKCRLLTKKLGADAAIDYRAYSSAEGIQNALREVCNGVDVYFDNVGGMVTDAVIPLINKRARLVICGQISQYNGGLDAPELGPRFLQHMLFQRATIQGVLARDFTHRMEEMIVVVAPWVRQGKVLQEETIIEGFIRLPEALNMLFQGKNTGKLIVKA